MNDQASLFRDEGASNKGRKLKKLSSKARKLRKGILEQFVFEDDASLAILDTAVRAFDLMNEAQAVVDEEGLTVQGDRGGVKAHPLLQVIRDQRAQFLAALKSLKLDIETGEGNGPGRPTDFEFRKKGRK